MSIKSNHMNTFIKNCFQFMLACVSSRTHTHTHKNSIMQHCMHSVKRTKAMRTKWAKILWKNPSENLIKHCIHWGPNSFRRTKIIYFKMSTGSAYAPFWMTFQLNIVLWMGRLRALNGFAAGCSRRELALFCIVIIRIHTLVDLRVICV